MDNDIKCSAKNTVDIYKLRKNISISYHMEPEANISLARNAAIRNSQSNIIAFIDDDEFPDQDWLLSLYMMFKETSADVVFGPVISKFDFDVPKWIIDSGAFSRESFASRTIIKNPSQTRTGNVLLNKSILTKHNVNFDIKLGRTGGEDIDLFAKLLMFNVKMVWCNEAIVYENVTLNRISVKYLLKRALLRGYVNSIRDCSESRQYMKSLLAIFGYSILLPFFAIYGRHVALKYSIKLFDHIGKVSTLVGYKTISSRSELGEP